ncbi:MAG TPA: HupE/UreJ family protein [Blastocatellia bacterium]|nr:HupE/UreJ family protein [Blastocatellia bacterium]
MLRRVALVLLTLGVLVPSVHAHPIPFSYLDIRINAGQAEGTLVVHIEDLAHDLNVERPEALLEAKVAASKKDAIAELVRTRLTVLADGQPVWLEVLRVEPLADRQAISCELRFNTKAKPGALRLECALFPYDPQHQTFLNVYEEDHLVHQEIFTLDHQIFVHRTGVRQGWMSVVKEFIPAGIYHIFTGPDHILFVVGLLLMGGSLLRLLSIVTAFTIAHSITLSLAALNVVDPSPRLIEPAIALSIVYVGIDNLMVGKTGRDVRAWIAFFFGFVHGFGFAGVLREFGLPREALGWSLFSFNFGVEIGQACIVVVVASLLAAIRNRNQTLAGRISKAGSVCVILAGTWWFIQRVFL